jgi:hypothetical protein
MRTSVNAPFDDAAAVEAIEKAIGVRLPEAVREKSYY